ncbi:hypothetical protein VNO77_22652 [Canavalia gladiata]|uniref:Uncharacterized protein n=1 Tax=Canavalia gladiata TaxID=3824 RepID=A0AAN9L357_CANGL
MILNSLSLWVSFLYQILVAYRLSLEKNLHILAKSKAKGVTIPSLSVSKNIPTLLFTHVTKDAGQAFDPNLDARESMVIAAPLDRNRVSWRTEDELEFLRPLA